MGLYKTNRVNEVDGGDIGGNRRVKSDRVSVSAMLKSTTKFILYLPTLGYRCWSSVAGGLY